MQRPQEHTGTLRLPQSDCWEQGGISPRVEAGNSGVCRNVGALGAVLLGTLEAKTGSMVGIPGGQDSAHPHRRKQV